MREYVSSGEDESDLELLYSLLSCQYFCFSICTHDLIFRSPLYFIGMCGGNTLVLGRMYLTQNYCIHYGNTGSGVFKRGEQN